MDCECRIPFAASAQEFAQVEQTTTRFGLLRDIAMVATQAPPAQTKARPVSARGLWQVGVPQAMEAFYTDSRVLCELASSVACVAMSPRCYLFSCLLRVEVVTTNQVCHKDKGAFFGGSHDQGKSQL